MCLPTQLAFRTYFAGDARDFGGERVELVHHGVDGVFQFKNFALHVHRDLAGQVSSRDGGCDFGDVTHLTGEVSGHGIHRIGEILPGSGDTGHVGLSA